MLHTLGCPAAAACRRLHVADRRQQARGPHARPAPWRPRCGAPARARREPLLRRRAQVQLLGQQISVGRPSGYVDPSKAQEAATAAAAALTAFQVPGAPRAPSSE